MHRKGKRLFMTPAVRADKLVLDHVKDSLSDRAQDESGNPHEIERRILHAILDAESADITTCPTVALDKQEAEIVLGILYEARRSFIEAAPAETGDPADYARLEEAIPVIRGFARSHVLSDLK